MDQRKRSGAKADLHTAVEQLRATTKADLQSAVEQIRSEMNHQYNDIVERVAESETRVLSAIYDLAKTGNKRMTHIEGDNAAMNNRLATIEDRLLEVEKRLTMPPAA